MIYIETQRLILRNFNKNDYEDVYEFLSQRKEEQFESYPNITYENGAEHLNYRVNNDEFVAIVLKKTNKIIGNIYFGNRNFNQKEIGYIINKDYQRNGYAYEAARALINDAFIKGIHRIYGECDPRNTCSWKLLEKLGFTKEALFRKNVSFRNDREGKPIYQDTFVYAILESDKKL